MIKLKIQKEPYWLELAAGVKVFVKPCSSAVFYEAKAFMNERISQVAHLYKSNKENGIVNDDIPDLSDTTKREAYADQNLILGLALAGITDWEGVYEAESDEKSPPTKEKIEELFSNFWIIAENFRNQYCGIHEMIEAEKKVLTPAADGISETGEATALDAPQTK